MVFRRRGVLDRTAILQVRGDASRAKPVIAAFGVDSGCDRMSSDHQIRARRL